MENAVRDSSVNFRILGPRPRVPLEQPSFYSNSLSITARSSNSSLSKDLEDNHLECTVREVEVNDLRP
ncbi:9057_t:CDS:2 [Funneliformis geosporum]|nr:9057_t:CDS:2 [Funneliformis geosporum]